MTEAEWLGCDDPMPMLYFLAQQPKQPSERKLRLFAVACCYRVRRWLVEGRSWKAVEGAERYAEGLIPADQLDAGLYADWKPGSPGRRTCHGNDLACYAA